MTAAIEPPPEDRVADLSNWRTTPYSRRAFHHVEELIASARIDNDRSNRRPLPAAAASLDAFGIALPNGATLDLASFLKATATDALVVLLDGRLVHESYDHGNDAGTPHILMSASKSIVGLLVGILRQRGELDVDAPVSHYLPAMAKTVYAGATIRHLLDMRTAVRFDEAQERAYAEANGWNPVSSDRAPQGLRSFFGRLDGPGATHGGPFWYVSANTDLLGLVIEAATGRTFAALVSSLLWQPMGAEHPALVTTDRDGASRATGGIASTARDLARIGQLLIDGGRCDDRVVVPADWIDDIATAGDHRAWADGQWGADFAPLSRNMRYRSGWYALDDDPKLLFAMGIHGQHLFVDRANRIVVAKCSSQAEPTDVRAIGLTLWAVAAIRRCLIAEN